MSKLAIRKNIRHLSKTELDDLVRAFDKIQKLNPNDDDSFFKIAGYHGEPFRGAGYGNPQWWGGYCNHGNVLFPTWHRAYLYRLEQALQAQVPGVALAYWDETEKESLDYGIPEVFLQPKYRYADGTEIDNPLYSYKFQQTILDRLNPIPDADYTKPKDYKTVRYPFSGLVGTDKSKAATKVHNERLEKMGFAETTKMLNLNIVKWLNTAEFYNHKGKDPKDPKKNKIYAGIKYKYGACLDAPNYTVFSNTTSAQKWNDDRVDTPEYEKIVPLESPHNSMHLAVGGFQIHKLKQDFNQYAGANGDMGENDTAAFDPIFFFHHCFVDLVFYEWQKKHNAVKSFDIIPGFPGTNSVDGQGPTPGVAGGTWLTLDSALDPFKKPGSRTEPMTSKDVFNPESLGYTYAYGDSTNQDSVVSHGLTSFMPTPEPTPIMEVYEINRARIGGSFMIHAWTPDENGDLHIVGTEAVLSRWHVAGCANCQNHLEVKTHIPLHGWTKEEAEAAQGGFEVALQTRDPMRLEGDGHAPMGFAPELIKPKFRILTGHMK